MDKQQEVAIVTGGARGLGFAIAERLARDGRAVAVLDLDGDGARNAAQIINAQGGRALGLEADLVNEAIARSAIAEAEAALGPVDILVNNVGQSARGRATEFWESGADVWRTVLDVCLTPMRHCSASVIGGMRARGSGRIVNMSSDAALEPTVCTSEYATAKAGVLGFTRVLALESAPFGVTVNALCPGPIRTEGLAEADPVLVASIAAKIPMQRIGEPRDVAAAVAFLVSHEASYITGQALFINGGRHMH